MSKLKLLNPVKRPIITQGFGIDNTAPSMIETYKGLGIKGHNGIDYVAFDGTPVYASHDGRVVYAGYDDAGGLGVVIRTEEDFEYKDGVAKYKSIYWHLKKGSLLVTGGQSVKAGQQIAEADNTGLSTGSHLHFGLKPIQVGEEPWIYYNLDDKNGYNGAIDPTPYFVPFQQDLVLGNTHEDVIRLQTELQKLNIFLAVPTGYYGEITAKAVLIFQNKYCNLSWYEKYVLRGTKFGIKSRTALNKLLGY